MRVFEEDMSKEHISQLTRIVKSLYVFGDEIQKLEASMHSGKERALLSNIHRDMQRRIGRLSDKVSKLSGFLKEKTDLLSKERQTGLVKEDDLFNYEEFFAQQRDQQHMEHHIQRLERRELESLTESISELSQTFVRMNELVFEQGAIIDRIDMNLSLTVERVDKANQQLEKAIEHQQGGLADACIKVLAVLVVIMTVVLLFKFS